MATMIELPDDVIAKLDAAATQSGRSRQGELEALVRRELESKDWIERYAGLWKDRTDIGDAVEYQRAIREDRDSG